MVSDDKIIPTLINAICSVIGVARFTRCKRTRGTERTTGKASKKKFKKILRCTQVLYVCDTRAAGLLFRHGQYKQCCMGCMKNQCIALPSSNDAFMGYKDAMNPCSPVIEVFPSLMINLSYCLWYKAGSQDQRMYCDVCCIRAWGCSDWT